MSLPKLTIAALSGALFLAAPAFSQSSTPRANAMLTDFQSAWSTQDTDGILAFFADEFLFEDVPLGLTASNKDEMRAILDYTFTSVPNFKMDIFDVYEGVGFVTTKWTQSGNATVAEMGLKDHPYEVTTTSIITLSEDGLITSVSDNWNLAVVLQ
ncbi:MAG: nuclear transport factor 2 family protein [Thalassovita sp.]